MATPRRIQKKGASLQINIPAEICASLDLHFGDYMIFVLGENNWCGITKIDLEKRSDLRDFLPGGLPKINYDK